MFSLVRGVPNGQVSFQEDLLLPAEHVADYLFNNDYSLPVQQVHVFFVGCARLQLPRATLCALPYRDGENVRC